MDLILKITILRKILDEFSIISDVNRDIAWGEIHDLFGVKVIAKINWVKRISY